MEIAYKQANLQQMEEKVSKEALERQLATQEKINHIEYVTGHDFYTENTVRIRISSKLASPCSTGTESCLTTGRA